MYFLRGLPKVCADFSIEDNTNCHSGHEELETTPRAKKIRKNYVMPWNVYGIKRQSTCQLSGFKLIGTFL